MIAWFNSLFNGAPTIDWKQVYQGPKDLPSLSEMIGKHVQMLQNSTEPKYVKTTDQKTITIVEKMFQKNPFIKQNILCSPGDKTNETQSLKVRICDINKHPFNKNVFENWKSKGRGRIIAIGGPSAHDQTLISTLIPSIKQTHDIHFYCRNFLQTNVMHCALQSHARHGNALNADPILSGRHLLPLIFKRLFFGVKIEQVVQRDFIKIDVKLNNFAYVMQYVKNQFNGILQIYKTWRGKQNQHDLNRFESVVSQQIQKVMQLNSKSQFTSRNHKTKQQSDMAIHLVFTPDQLDEILLEHIQHARVQAIKIKQVPQQELKQLFPQAKQILAGFRYIGDYATKLDMYDIEKKKSIQNGAVWNQNKTVSKVYIDKDQHGIPFTCGVQFTDGQYVPADKVHLTLGYKAAFYFEDTDIKALRNINIPVAGVSTNLLFEKTPELKKIIDNKGNLQLQITSNNWSIIGHNDSHVLFRGTAGGNTGSEAYQPSHFLNLCRNTRSIFGDAFVGVVSVYGCPRAVNYKNSTQFCKVANGLVISYGKGGTGNTKRSAEAYKALTYLGLQQDVEWYFNKVSQSRVNIVSSMKKILKQSQQVGFYYQFLKQTRKHVFHSTAV